MEHLFEVKVPEKATSQGYPPPGSSRRQRPISSRKFWACHDLQRRRRPACQQAAQRWHLSFRHHPMGKTQYRDWKFRYGIRMSASNAVNALSSAPTLSSAPKCTMAALLKDAPETFKSLDAKFREFPDMKFTVQVSPEDCTGCGHVRGKLPRKRQGRSQPQSDQHGSPTSAARKRKRRTGNSSSTCPIRTAPLSKPNTVKNSASCCARCSSSPALARAAVRHLTLDCSPSYSVTILLSPTQPAAPPFTAATCPPRLTPSTVTAAVLPGRTPCSKTTRNLVWVCA